ADVRQAPKAPCLVVQSADRADLHAWLRAHAFDDAPLLLLQPGNKRTLKPGLRIILCGAPPEAALLRRIASGAGSERVLAAGDELPLRRLLALCEHATAMISIDTGPAQAAAALGCPLVVL